MKTALEIFISWLNALFQGYDNRKEFDTHDEPVTGEIEDGADVPDDISVCTYECKEEIDVKPTPVEEVVIKAPRYLWCLNNGHGELQEGKRSPFWTEDGRRLQFLEYEFNRAVVALLMPMLDERGIKYYNVVPEISVGQFLEERVRRGNAKLSHLEKVWLGIHANAAPTPNPQVWASRHTHGVETWFYHTSKKGRKLASIFQHFLIQSTGRRDRGIKSRSTQQFYELRKTQMPSVILELDFYNNPEIVKELMLPVVQKEFARAICEAIVYIELNGLDVSELPKLIKADFKTDENGNKLAA